MPALAQNTPQGLVIDLTASDDEDTLTASVLYSNDGLPTTGLLARQGLQRGEGALGHNYADRIIPSTYPGGVRSTASSGGRRSPRALSYSHARRALDSTRHGVGHVSKKRKISQGHRASVAVGDSNLRPPQNHERQVRPAKSESTSSRPSSELPEVLAVKMRSSEGGNNRSLSTIADQNSPRSSKKSPQGHRSSATIRAPSGSIELMLNSQVLPYIKAALGRFSNDIPIHERDEIGNRVGKILVDDPHFGRELNKNNFVLSSDYEIQLSRKAETLVNQHARAFLTHKAASTPQGKSSNKIVSPRIPLLDASDRASAGTDLSSDPEEIFELRPDIPFQVRSSFSPSTPLSNDLAEHESSSETPMKSIERAVEKDHPTDRQRPERSTRAIKPAYIPQRRARRWHKRPLDDRDSSSTATPMVDQVRTYAETPVIVPNQKQAVPAVEQDHRQASDIILRPYLTCSERQALISDLEASASGIRERDDRFATSHIPFSESEADMLVAFLLKRFLKVSVSKRTHSDPLLEIAHLMSNHKVEASKLASRIAYNDQGLATAQNLRGRNNASITAFLEDAAYNKIHEYTTFSSSPPLRTLNRNYHLSNILRQRETFGLEPLRVRKGGTSYREEISSFIEDLITPLSEWTDCSGDIAALSWASDETFIVGALTHFDPHNMQYNRPGNLLVGSIAKDSLRAYPDHKITRPLISESQNKENALDSMRRTQDPWMYASVVCTAHSSVSGFSFTSSYDRTVKVWKVSKDGSSMELCGTWEHEARVNFVATSEHHDRVATASETYKDAVRIYDFNKEAITESAYDEYGGNKSQEQSDIESKLRWAYKPATMKWARAPKVAHLLLVGYSPRSESGDDSDIPDDKKNTGELCVWDFTDGSRYNVSSSRTSNIFETVWHPTQQIFAAATSPSGNFDSDRTKTQVRIFALNDRIFTMIMALDCPALDINELTIMPNSTVKCYVTASCTDGNTYVWDTAQGEDPIHVLGHGDSLDNPDPDIPLELADGGVTFASWGATVDRFYTGATDGKLKAWDIRRPLGFALVRNVLELSGGISSGAFSKDFRKLLIGDGTGKVHFLGIEDDEPAIDKHIHQPREMLGTSGILPTSIKRPKVIIPHPEPAPPEGFYEITSVDEAEQSIRDTCLKYIEEGFLEIHQPKGVFQGPNYQELGFYRFEAHTEMDVTKPLLPDMLALQQYTKDQQTDNKMWSMPILPKAKLANTKEHKKNKDLDFAFNKLSLETQTALKKDRVELDWDVSGTFTYDMTPSRRIFRLRKRSVREGEAQNPGQWI